MKIVNIRQAKAQFSRLINQAAKGEAFIITKAGKPMVKGVAFDVTASSQIRRTGFIAGQISVPDDFDRMDIEEIFPGQS